MSGNLGVNKTRDRILQLHFYWPKLRRRVAEIVKICHVWQMFGKPTQNVKLAPLNPYKHLMNNLAGWLSCRAHAKDKIHSVEENIIPGHSQGFDQFFTPFGMPQEFQSDIGSNFTSGIFPMHHQLAIKHVMASAYHSRSQGALESWKYIIRHHKPRSKRFCFDNQKDCDEGIRLLLFATREVVQ